MDYLQRLRSRFKLRPRTSSPWSSSSPSWPRTPSRSPSASSLASSSSSSSPSSPLSPRHHHHHSADADYHDSAAAAMGLTDLPFPIFLDVVLLLSPVDIVKCQRVSADLRHALTRPDLVVSLILLHFPRAREARELRRWLAGAEAHIGPSPFVEDLERTNWASVFSTLARRYYHLGVAKPWSVFKVPALGDECKGLWPVAPWNRFLKLADRAAEFQHWDPVWAFAPDDGLLVYPCAVPKSPAGQWVYKARDLETGAELTVPFDTSDKIVRRVRLNDSVLLFEWCEARGSHPISTTETAHRHYATAFDVVRHGPSVVLPIRADVLEDATNTNTYKHNNTNSKGSKSNHSQPPRAWSFDLIAEWKIHFLGLPLSHQDRFFSTHNRTHYAVYIWQPTRSPWGEDDPLERLVIWEFGGGRPHRVGRRRPGSSPDADADSDDESGPRVVHRLVNAELEAWGVRQRDTPSLRGLSLDATTWDDETQSSCGHVYVVEESHRWAAGPHSTHAVPRLHRVRTTGIPIRGTGPKLQDECDAAGSPCYSCWHRTTQRMHLGQNQKQQQQRQLCSEPPEGRAAPCWRHDDFPFLTVSHALDADAGVRISARQCFGQKTLTAQIPSHLRQTFGLPGGREPRPPGWDMTRAHFMGMVEWSDMEVETLEVMHERADGPSREDEVEFPSDLWGELMGKGYICGNERWVVGEDAAGDITIALF